MKRSRELKGVWVLIAGCMVVIAFTMIGCAGPFEIGGSSTEPDDEGGSLALAVSGLKVGASRSAHSAGVTGSAVETGRITKATIEVTGYGIDISTHR